MASEDTPTTIRLTQLAERLDELATEQWAADWPTHQADVQKRFDDIRRQAKQLLGLEGGEKFWLATNPAKPKEPSHLEERRAQESAIKKAAQILRGQAE